MQKRSHTLLAASLLQSRQGFSARRYEWAFILGSFQPDCNPFTFLRGSFRARTLGGHSFSNSRRYISTRIRKLQQRSDWRIGHYYLLGKLTHYLADAFTYPHNCTFPDTLMDHHKYETALRRSLVEHLSTHSLAPHSRCHDLPAAIDRLHRQYEASGSDVRNDIRYILEATGLLMASCDPHPLHTQLILCIFTT